IFGPNMDLNGELYVKTFYIFPKNMLMYFAISLGFMLLLFFVIGAHLFWLIWFFFFDRIHVVHIVSANALLLLHVAPPTSTRVVVPIEGNTLPSGSFSDTLTHNSVITNSLRCCMDYIFLFLDLARIFHHKKEICGFCDYILYNELIGQLPKFFLQVVADTAFIFLSLFLWLTLSIMLNTTSFDASSILSWILIVAFIFLLMMYLNDVLTCMIIFKCCFLQEHRIATRLAFFSVSFSCRV
ncbi:hypothetical protein ACJX0J_007226, partial [Zea mays]